MKTKKLIITMSQLTNELEVLVGKTITPLIIVFIYSVVQLIRFGNQSNYLLLLFGCILSTVIVIGYFINEITNAVKKGKSFIAMFLALSGLIAWAFGCYLVFLCGFWSLKELVEGFSITLVIKSFLFIVLGYRFISNFSKITDIGRSISDGSLIIHDKDEVKYEKNS